MKESENRGIIRVAAASAFYMAAVRANGPLNYLHIAPLPTRGCLGAPPPSALRPFRNAGSLLRRGLPPWSDVVCCEGNGRMGCSLLGVCVRCRWRVCGLFVYRRGETCDRSLARLPALWAASGTGGGFRPFGCAPPHRSSGRSSAACRCQGCGASPRHREALRVLD